MRRRAGAAVRRLIGRLERLLHDPCSLRRMRDVFASVDADGSGCVTRAELAQAAALLGVPIRPAELAAAWPALDVDRSGALEYGEFEHMLRMSSGEAALDRVRAAAAAAAAAAASQAAAAAVFARTPFAQDSRIEPRGWSRRMVRAGGWVCEQLPS